MLMFCVWCQVYLVVGGENREGLGYLSSAEILVKGTYAWTSVSSLSQSYWLMKMVSLDNIPYMFGQRRYIYYISSPYLLLTGGDNGAAQPTIFKFNTDIVSWEMLSLQMRFRRKGAGASLIDAEKIFQWC